MSAAQAWRWSRAAFNENAAAPSAEPAARHRRPIGSRHLSIALIACTPFAIVTGWLWLDSPLVFDRFVGRFLLAGILLLLFVGLGLRVVRRRAVSEMRLLNRMVRRIETGDFDGTVPHFNEPEIQRLVVGCIDIGERMRSAEDQLAEARDRARRDRMRHESVLESVESENARLRAETSVLHSFGGVLIRGLATPQICAELINNLRGKIEFVRATVYLLDSSGHLVPQALCDREHRTPLAGNFLKDTPAGQELSTRTVPGWVAQTGKVVSIDDVRNDSRCADLTSEARSVLAVPLQARESILGVIQLEHPHPHAYDHSDERILASLANQAAIAVENVRLFEEAAKVQALRELDRLKSELLSTVSHELRTPLASIKGYAGTLLRDDVDWDDETRREFLQIIDEESDRLGELIEDLLQMSQIEAGILRVDPQPMRLPRIAQRVVKKARSAAQRHHFNVAFSIDFPEIWADARRVEQVLRNLIENAVKYSPEGGTVTVRGDVKGDAVVISISDEGIGIAPEDLERVFDRFYRASGAEVRRAGGTGLGLSICQGIVQMHGGQIWAESQLGSGTSFHFTLPITGPSGAIQMLPEHQEESA